ncbi:MAG: ABC transporter ATP-binding protein [Deltaproteobacteria bacterium]|jgi:putative ABC transport system ATP-binding protein
MIEVSHVTKIYGGIEALHDVSLHVQRGDFVSIVGPSGSGKSTFLNLLAGLLTPTGGEVVVDGISLYKLSPKERTALRRDKFGFIFQTFNLIPYLTAIENVEIPLYLAGVPQTKQRAIATELLDKVGLKDRVSHLPSELSIGEQQRVAVARALTNNASVILADEPTGNLDTKSGGELMGYVKKLNGGGVTVLLVTHDPAIAGFAQRKIKIVDGRLMQ